MSWWLAGAADSARRDNCKRFDARFWTVDFPRPMMAAATMTAPGGLRVDAVFYQAGDLAGLIWDSADVHDHPLLAYTTSPDYRGCTLSFHWRSSGLLPLDVPNGATLTIQGRDAGGAAATSYVRLWNYAVGANTDAVVTLPFDTLQGGYSPGGAAVYVGDIDRMFISLVPAGYTGTATPFSAPVEAWVTLDSVACDGVGSVLTIGDAFVPEHGLNIAGGYDDSYNLTPARLLRNVFALGYRGWIDHYVGMSHYFRLAYDASSGSFLAGTGVGSPLNVACAAWHSDLLARAAALGFRVILSLSYELFDPHAPQAWKQRASDGPPAQSGYVPPSTLLSPTSAAAMGYLRSVGAAFVKLAAGAGAEAHFQVGEPWWWVNANGAPCVYDAATTAAYAATGKAVPPAVTSVGAVLSADQGVYFDWCGAQLGASTLALRDAVKAAVPSSKTYLLFFTPQLVGANVANLSRLNLPAQWAWPAFDVLQLEDYDFVTAGDLGSAARALALVTAKLGYPLAAQDYFAGFAFKVGDPVQWSRIASAAEAGRARGVRQTFVWALPQVVRDGFTYFSIGAAVQSFDDVSFPLALGAHASVAPSFFTQVVTRASGYEQRNAQWATARLRFDAGLGVRSEADLGLLVAFFRARRGPAAAFRFRDPLDSSSAGMAGVPGAFDQALGVGDGTTTQFSLVKTYDPVAPPRRITRPVAASVAVGTGGAATSAWTLGPLGVVQFTTAPKAGVAVTAGYTFDVPVRFADDALDVNLAAFRSGDVPSVPLIEVREG